MTENKYIQWLLLEEEGLLSEEDREKLARWLDASETNRQLAERIRNLGALASGYKKDLEIDLGIFLFGYCEKNKSVQPKSWLDQAAVA